MLGTKCPSITSRWIQSAPAASTARTSSPSLAKSDARIDGAMTRGRDANCGDMCALPKTLEKHFERAGVPRLTCAKPGGNAGQTGRGGRKILPQRYQLPGWSVVPRDEKPRFYWAFGNGTALADR